MSSWGRGIATFGAHQRPIVGDTKTTTVGEDHLGWLLCDGRLLDPTDFQDLYKVIGYQFGRAGPLFRLPDPAGRVLGMIGSPNAANPSLTTRYMGGLSGEEMHTLIIAEIPSHNHGTNASDSIPGNNLTGISGEHIHGITDPTHNHGITDPTHSHSYSTYANANRGYVAATDNDGILADTQSISTGASSTGITVNNASTGITVNIAGNHQHTIASQGGSDPHNNIQPTLWIGNVFIYSGKTGFNRSKVYSGAFPNSGSKLY